MLKLQKMQQMVVIAITRHHLGTGVQDGGDADAGEKSCFIHRQIQ